MSAAYRLRQFGRGLVASLRRQPLRRDEERLVDALLTPAARRLFARQPVDAQRHGLNVLHDLQRAARDEPALRAPALQIAALLHDAGKVAAAEAGVPITLWLRGPLVVLEALLNKRAPDRLRAWASDNPQHGWRYALHVHLQHPAIGATWAQAAGCPPLACWLIAHHQNEPPADTPAHRRNLLVALQQADNRN